MIFLEENNDHDQENGNDIVIDTEDTQIDQEIKPSDVIEDDSQVEEGESTPTDDSDSQWEATLEDKMGSKKMKKALKKEKRQEFKEKLRLKKQELNAKSAEKVEGELLKVLDKKVIIYTILFLVGAGLILFFGTNQNKPITITISFIAIIGVSMLYFLSRFPKIHDLMFSQGHIFRKILLNIFAYGIGFGIYMAFIYGWDEFWGEKAEFLVFESLFGLLLPLSFFLWNAIQIWFVKSTVENVAVKSEAKFRVKAETKTDKKINAKITLKNTISLVVPFLIHIVIVILLLLLDREKTFTTLFPNSTVDFTGFTGRFTINPIDPLEETLPFNFSQWLAIYPSERSNFGAFLIEYFPAIWWDNAKLQAFFLWIVLIFIILIALTIRQAKLFKQSKENNSKNIFSGVFYLIFFIFLYLKFYSVFNLVVSLTGLAQDAAPDQIPLFYQIVDWASSFFLMIITILNLIRGFGKKIKGDTSTISKYRRTLQMFIFVLIYWGGQFTLISSGMDQASLNLATSLLVSCIYIGFYYWYSSYVLERRGFIRKKSFTRAETKEMMLELSQRYKNRLLQTIENGEIIQSTLNEYLLEQRIVLEDGEEEDAQVDTMEVEEEETTPVTRLEKAQTQYEEARSELEAFEAAVAKLKQSKEYLKTLQPKITAAQKLVDALKPTIDRDFDFAEVTHQEWLEKCQEKEDIFNKSVVKLDAFKKPIEPKPHKTASGEIDHDATELLMKEYNEKFAQYQVLEKDKEAKEAAYQECKAKMEKQAEEWTKLQKELQDAQAKRDSLHNLTTTKDTLEAEIKALEKDIIVLEERKNDAQPLLDIATALLDNAKTEKEKFEELEAKIAEEEQAIEKLHNAEKVHQQAEMDLKTAQEELALTKSIEDNQADIEAALEKIATFEAKIKGAEAIRSDCKLAFEEKTEALNNAKEAHTEANNILETALKLIQQREKDLKNAEEHLQKGKALKADLKRANAELDTLKSQQNEKPSVENVESTIKEHQAQLKEFKSDLKLEKKRDPINQSKIDEFITKINDLESQIKDDKALLKEVKGIASDVSNQAKKVSQIEGSQINLEEAQEQVTECQKLVEEASEAKMAPSKVKEEKLEEMQQAQHDYDVAKLNLTNAESDLKDNENGLAQSQGEKEAAEVALQTRKDAEAKVKETTQELKNAKKLLTKAQENRDAEEQNKIEAQHTFDLKKENAALEREIFKAQKALKEAHKTFKLAVRKAEANVVGCEQILQDKIAHKKEVFESRKKPVVDSPAEEV
ncbi:hypothetical protein WKT22_01228 [Candidatus Lokiarchaeum ossiferum]